VDMSVLNSPVLVGAYVNEPVKKDITQWEEKYIFI